MRAYPMPKSERRLDSQRTRRVAYILDGLALEWSLRRMLSVSRLFRRVVVAPDGVYDGLPVCRPTSTSPLDTSISKHLA